MINTFYNSKVTVLLFFKKRFVVLFIPNTHISRYWVNTND